MPQVIAEVKRINNRTLRLARTDITDLDVDAFVFYAQANLALGAGFGTAISVRGGPTIQKELQGLAPVPTGQAVVTAAGNLKAQWIIHAVGPKFQEEDLEQKLRTTVINSLRRAEEKGVQRLALPAMGAGYYGVDPDLSARVMLELISNHLQGETSLQEVVICVLDTPQYRAFQARMAALP